MSYHIEYEDITEDLVVIKINQTYHENISARELYEYTRGFWRRRIESVSTSKYALAVVYGEVKEVYKIDKWIHASEADNIFRKYDPARHSNRIAFCGDVADDAVRQKYIGRSVDHLYKFGEASPVKMFKGHPCSYKM